MDDRLGESRHREERERGAQWRSVGSSPRIESPPNIEIEPNRVEIGAIENETRRGGRYTTHVLREQPMVPRDAKNVYRALYVLRLGWGALRYVQTVRRGNRETEFDTKNRGDRSRNR